MHRWLSALLLLGALMLSGAKEPPQSSPPSGLPSVSGGLLDVAKQIFHARSHSVSEVLTLNLTNLLILLVLKAIMFGMGFFYMNSGHHGGGAAAAVSGGYGGATGYGSGYGRSSDGEASSSRWMSEAEMMLLLTYLMGSSSEDYDCLYRVACEEPNKAKDYLTAAKMALKGAKMFKSFITLSPKYEHVVYGLQEALEHRKSGGNCKARYSCSGMTAV